MKFRYYPETDTLYISLHERESSEGKDIAPNVVIDLDADGRLIGIEIEHASETVDLTRLEAESLPVSILSLVAQ